MAGPLEVDTCRDVILPALRAAGWQDDQIREQFPVRAQRVLSAGGTARDLGAGRVDYVLEIVPGLPVAVVEAKREYREAGEGLQQAVRYAQQVDVPVAYASNGRETIEKDLFRGVEHPRTTFRSPAGLWSDYCAWCGIDPQDAELLRRPFNRKKLNAELEIVRPRWYQQVAVNRVLTHLARGDRRLLLLMATGTGKTYTAMQVVAKLRAYQAFVDPTGTYRVLYLADRDALVQQPMDKDFGIAFGQDPLARVGAGRDGKSRDIVFATYQSLTAAGDTTALLRYAPDFFDLVIVDECHRGSADENSQWRAVLDHFGPAAQLGLTATPKQEDTVDTYRYFGEPVFSYSLREGIEDGYLAPYRVRRVVLDVDADGWSPAPGQLDDDGVPIPDGLYGWRDFERTLVLTERTRVVASYLVDLLRKARGRMIVFCVDQEHAHRMREEMSNLAPEWTRDDPEWVVRITGDEEEKTRLIQALCDPDRDSPLVATTSRLLATGIDVEDLRYVVIVRAVGSQVEFKQIVGRGTRLYPAKGKTSFEIVDFVGAIEHFKDPTFDGFPTKVIVDTIDKDGDVTATESTGGDVVVLPTGEQPLPDPEVGEDEADFRPENPLGGAGDTGHDPQTPAPSPPPRHRYRVSAAGVALSNETLFVPDTSTGTLRLTDFAEFVGDRVRTMAASPDDLATRWSRKPGRETVLSALAAAGIDPDALLGPNVEGVDLFDLLVTLAWHQPTRTRAERARRVRERHHTEIEQLSQAAREIIEALLDRYATDGIDDATSPEVLSLPPLSGLGSRRAVLAELGDKGWTGTVDQLQDWIYSTETAS